MCASPLNFLRSGPPPPKVALLPDALFFTRTVPIAGVTTPAEVAAQVELALEALAPFPLAQLYYGHYWTAGANHALVFAAYRRRFTVEQTSQWAGAELVLPTFAAVFGAEVAPATTVVLSAPEGFTAVHWDAGRVPSGITFHPLAPEATEEERAAAREALLASVGGTKKVVELATPPAAQPSRSDSEIVFRSGEFASRLEAVALPELDVRDKAELAQLRRARARDLVLWRILVGSAAALLLLLVGEIGLVAGNGFWQKARLLKVSYQQPVVDKIMKAQSFATRIRDRSTKRLLPLEMISFVAQKMPGEVWFTKINTTGLYTITFSALTSNSGQISVFKSALGELPEIEPPVFSGGQSLPNNLTSFTLTVTFKPEALKPADS